MAAADHARYQLALALLLLARALASPHYGIIQVILSMPNFPAAITWCCCWKSRHRRLRQIFFRILSLFKQTQMGRCVGLLAGLWLTGLDALMFGLGYFWLGKCVICILLPLNAKQFLPLWPQCFMQQCARIMIHLESVTNTKIVIYMSYITKLRLLIESLTRC